jgi:hypothetical protein
MLPDPIQLLARVAKAFEQLGIPYMTGGSLASSQYGIPRSTQDVDLVADLQLQHVAPLVQSLQDEFYLDAGQIREAIRNCSSFNLIHLESVYKVDVFIASVDPWGREQMNRRRPEELVAGETLYFASPEDVVLHKLGWYQEGGSVSDRQWSDVIGILSVQESRLDFIYLRDWAIRLGLVELLDRALRDAGLE